MFRFVSIVALFTSICFADLAFAQESKTLELPDCDIFLLDLNESGDGVGLLVSDSKNITEREGYDNQPWFASDSKSVLYTANPKPDRTDVFAYVLSSGQTRQITDSPTQEYSPQSSPDQKTLSYVTDGAKANQSIWVYGFNDGKESWLLKNQGEREPVGYYSWNRKTNMILYWSRYGYNVRLVSRDGEKSHYIAGNTPPSTPHIIPGTDNFSFLHRQGNGEVWLKELNPETLAVRPLVAIQGSNNNYCWTPSGQVLLVDGNDLLRWNMHDDAGWENVAELTELGIRNATRVAVSPDGSKLAIVGLPAK